MATNKIDDLLMLNSEFEKASSNSDMSPLIKGKLYKINEDDYGNPIFLGDNTVTLAGALAALEKLFKVPAPYVPPYLNTSTSGPVPTGASVVSSETTQLESSVVCLFGVGIIGDEYLTFGQVPDPSFRQNIISGMIPLRITANSSTIPPYQTDNINKYVFPCTLSDGSCGWYLKEFDGASEIKSLFKNATSGSTDGTVVDGNNIDTNESIGIETFAQNKLAISRYDVIDWFTKNNILNLARFNSIGLFMADKTTVGDNTTYANIRLFSVVNIENVSVKNPTDNTYLYRVYTAI